MPATQRAPLLPVVLVLLCLSGCADKMDRFLHLPPQAEQGSIKHKAYSSPPLSIFALKELIEMAVYTGPPESYGELVLRRATSRKGADPVVFSHRTHRSRYTCRVCHLELEFSMKKDGTDISQEDLLMGRYCGACHNGTIAFAVDRACNLCHIKEVNQQQGVVSRFSPVLAEGLPSTAYGDHINWVKALENGMITPKTSLSEEAPPPSLPLPKHLEAPLQWYTNTPGVYVAFPHKAHVAWLDCANCHPDIFDLKNMGTVAFDKEKNLYGMFCGSCHMTVAFPINGCSRCHPRQKDWR